MRAFGIDISEYQNGFNFDKAVAEGVTFAILRGAYALKKDKCFEGFYAACKARNIPVGCYHYTMAKTVDQVKKEADFLIENVLAGKQFEYPIYIDVEDRTQRALGKKLLTDIIVAYCETLEKAGYYVGIYTGITFIKSCLDETKLTAYDKWIAQWSSKCQYWDDYGVWQFGGETNYIRTNKVAGVVCDQDYSYKDYPSIIKAANLNGYGRKTIDELATEVIAGKWGVGAARKTALENAGYNYDAVQAEVNKRLTRKSVTEIAKEVIAGKWGVGQDRKKKLTAAGYDYKAVQAEVNKMLR